MRQITLLLALTAAASASLTTGEMESHLPPPVTPNHDSARENANLIFNALHSAGRQWGSSFYHNGFGFFPAEVPRGTLFYHGTSRNETPTGFEWLAFEIEHAENFARSFRLPRDRYRPPPPEKHNNGGQVRLTGDGLRSKEIFHQLDDHIDPDTSGDHRSPSQGDDDMVNYRGYLHTYQANRDLKLLLIDGMSAGKTSMGTLDSQDLILRENSTKGGFDEWRRASELCDLVTGWGYDGVVRMEIGFEVIHCDFHRGLDRIAMKRTMLEEDKIGNDSMSMFRWSRAATERYDGVGGDRLRIDFSSMVSGLFFPINISSTDADRPDLKRLAASSLSDLIQIKAYLKRVATGPRRFTVNWQATVDLIVTRFSRPLRSMAYQELPIQYFIDEVDAATLVWIDAPEYPDDVTMEGEHGKARKEAVAHCRANFLRSSSLSRDEWSLEDELIHTSIDAVMGDICDVLFSVRDLLLNASTTSNRYHIGRVDDGNEQKRMSRAVGKGRIMLRELMDRLGWTTWKQLQPCGPDKVLFIAMWPFGGQEDHWNPGCRSADELAQRPSNSYWKLNRGRPPPKVRDGDE